MQLNAQKKFYRQNSMEKSDNPAGTQRCFNVHITLFGYYER